MSDIKKNQCFISILIWSLWKKITYVANFQIRSWYDEKKKERKSKPTFRINLLNYSFNRHFTMSDTLQSLPHSSHNPECFLLNFLAYCFQETVKIKRNSFFRRSSSLSPVVKTLWPRTRPLQGSMTIILSEVFLKLFASFLRNPFFRPFILCGEGFEDKRIVVALLTMTSAKLYGNKKV